MGLLARGRDGSRLVSGGSWSKLPGRVNIFALGPVQAINGTTPACSGVEAELSLTADAANALGAPSFSGAFVGDACVAPATHQHGHHD